MNTMGKGTYFGRMTSEREVHGILLSEYDYLLPETEWHFHENPYFMYVLQGGVWDSNKLQTQICSTGSVVFHNWQEAHFNRLVTKETRGFHLEFDRDWYEANQLDVNLWEGSAVMQDPRVHQTMALLYSEFKLNEECSELSIELLTLKLCEQVQTNRLPSIDSPPVWLNQLKDILHSGAIDYNLDTLASILDIHPVHLSRAVPKYLATTLGEYVRQLRLKKALGQLLDHRKSLTAIALDSGFSDQSHFTRTFKRYFGQTPSQFRKRFRA